MIFVKLTPDEVKKVKKLMRDAKDARLYQRAQIIWLSYLKKKVPEIAKIVGLEEHAVRRWIRRYEEEGIEGFTDKPRPGRPRKVTQEYERKLLEVVHKSPKLFGYSKTNWTLQLLAKHMRTETGVRICFQRVHQILSSHKIVFRRPKLHLVSPDPEYDFKKN